MDRSAAIADPHDVERKSPFLRGIRAAFALLTRLPVGGFPYSDRDLQWSAAHLPLVGALVGVALSGVWIASGRAGGLVAAVLVVIASLLLTGAIHEDGLADTADALGGGTDRHKILMILKDSRIGSFGGSALVVSILLRVALLARLGGRVPAALVLTELVSRAAPVVVMAMLPYVTDSAVAKSGAIATTTKRHVAVALGWVLVITAALLAIRAFTLLEIASAISVTAAITLACVARFRARVGGYTGDFLGATQQVVLCATLFTLVLLAG